MEKQVSVEESRERINRLKEILPRHGCKLKWHDPEQSFLEGVFSRGDRRLAILLQIAWQNGARLDGWSDHFKPELWRQAAEQCGLDLDDYLRQRDFSEILPWQHLQSGVDYEFLKDELEKAQALIYTPDCRYHGCQKCGICDFRAIKPIVHNRKMEPNSAPSTTVATEIRTDKEQHFKYLVTYQRTGNICYLGHLEILQLIFRGLRRARIQTNFSQGFNPSPKVSFGPALPVGMESLAEYFVMDLPSPLADPEKTAALLDESLPDGIHIETVELHSGKIPQNTVNTYRIVLSAALRAEDNRRIEEFQKSVYFPVARERKGKRSEIDLRPLVVDIVVKGEDTIILQTINRAGVPGIKIQEALQQILGLDENLILSANILKTDWNPL